MSAADLPARLQEGQQFLQQGRLNDAESLFRSILAEQPAQPGASYGLAAALSGQGRLPEAIAPMTTAVQAFPEDLNARLQFGQMLRNLGRNEPAAEQFREALRLNASLPAVWNTLGNIYRDIQQPEESRQCLLKAIEQQPDMPEAWNNLGSLYSELGQSDTAVEHYREAIRLRPDYFKAWRNLTVTRKFSVSDTEVQQLEALYAEHQDDDFAVMQLGFALGKVYEDLGEPARAFECWLAGNRAQRKLAPFSVQSHLDEMQAMSRIFTAERLTRADGAAMADRMPIFVIGMPRSGTSLTEQIIAAHSQGFGAGELESIRHLAWHAVEGRFPAGLADLEPQQWRSLGQQYLDELGQRAGAARYVVDKMPRNFQHVGMIAMMLRDARFIHCRRDPLDIGLSCFKTHFPAPDLGYSCDLEDLGAYFRYYRALMDHWHRVLPGRIFDLDYAALVAEPESQIRRLLDWCAIPFEADCLSPHRQKRFVATASALQVREPIHQGALQRWKQYATQLQPLSAALAEPDPVLSPVHHQN